MVNILYVRAVKVKNSSFCLYRDNGGGLGDYLATICIYNSLLKETYVMTLIGIACQAIPMSAYNISFDEK